MLEQSVPRVEMYSGLPCFSTFFHWKLYRCAICGHQKRMRHQLKALLGPYDRHIRFFDEAKGCYESLRPLGESALAETYLKKLNDTQERFEIIIELMLGRNIV